MNSMFFYCNFEPSDINESCIEFINVLSNFSESNSVLVYALNEFLGEQKLTYDFNKGILVLIPKHKLFFINFSSDEDAFEEFMDDFVEDIGYISTKYDFKDDLGRPKRWKDKYFSSFQYESAFSNDFDVFLSKLRLSNATDIRKIELIMSLVSGNINDVKRVGGSVPSTDLEKIKKNIIMFDGEQARFIYKEPINIKKIRIQGLAGTGKTELLMHKLRKLYTEQSDTKIVFTCFNKVLAEVLRTRIPEFFDFMKVEEQIKWHERLWVMASWGSKANKNSGVYSYICNYYNINFMNFGENPNFTDICEHTLAVLNTISDFEPCFDYILIDESQDFDESFFNLCDKVSRKQVYIAGDIFQNVFDKSISSEVTPNFLLNKCYRTDPRTLMFAHGVGMGLFEKPVIRWLENSEWKACGYNVTINKENKKNIYQLSRAPIRRFEDINSSYSSVMIDTVSDSPQKYVESIINTMKEIQKEYPDVYPDDIGIIFLEANPGVIVEHLIYEISKEFKWDSNRATSTKEKIKSTVFISNKNNVKGLEFPFIICVATSVISKSLRVRNALYMILTRSFLKSYLLLSEKDESLSNFFVDGINEINKNGFLSIEEPTEEEKEISKELIINTSKVNKSFDDIFAEKLDFYNFDMLKRKRLYKAYIELIGDKFDGDEEKIVSFIESNEAFINE